MPDFQWNRTLRPLNRVRLSWLVIAFLVSFQTAAARLTDQECLCDRMVFPPTNHPVGRVIGGQIVDASPEGLMELASAAVIYEAKVIEMNNEHIMTTETICGGTSSNRTECPFIF